MEERKRFVLFDFDGVIADSFALGHDIARIVHAGVQMSPDDYRALFEGNVYDALDKNGIARKDTEYFNHYASRMEEEVGLFTGMDSVVQELARSYRLFIVSSTTSELIRMFLTRHALDQHFEQVMGSDIHSSKTEKIRMIFNDYGVHADRCVFVTDTLGDMREAKEHRIGAIAVSWGWHSHGTLEKGIPFRIVDTPAELPDAVDDYFAGDRM
jgi:phosphoglycolate phosphatase